MTSHTDAIDARDIANLHHVRDLFGHADPVPSDLAERIKFAITVHALHAEVAELMDSALLTTRGADAKVEPTPTDSVTFTAASVSLMVSSGPADSDDTDDADDRVRVDGWVTTPGAQIEAVTTEGSSTVISDANGRFVLDDLPHGPVHFVVTDPGNADMRPVITPTIQI
ncbi:carboxypeptidase-like regulatory domain-containing protein [Terracoccus sp. 273MFTsu3.1]|uniref:carboxypeptidase-like regulatory domain-containing protein n=1 Tax=Terracoccus sp. 273MFTsu3.1 TaxID=1172188 RepID=UPI0003785098|nr:carboxypeptidase-like regulatory domain-containing protein [Terracoccus sp. 273MFTsu3.1]